MTELIEVHTATLNGAALDWAVAKVEGRKVEIVRGGSYGRPDTLWFIADEGGQAYSPSKDWAVAGPLLDKYHVSLIYAFEEYEALIGMTGSGYHSSATVAACRAIVAAAALGDTVQVPKELI
jgi:hypothetical protein